MIRKITISAITIGSRHRKEMGDLGTLAQSIKNVGLLQPIGVTSKMQLVWGQRRLKACEMLGWSEIDAVVDPSLDDIVRAMKAEEDENNCRLPFSASERVAIANHIESIEQLRAAERKREGQKKGGQARHSQLPADSAESCPTALDKNSSDVVPNDRPISATDTLTVDSDPGETREKVAAAVGMSHDTLAKARKVVTTGTPELIEAMDKGTASVNAAAQIASLPPKKQRQVVAGGKKAIKAAAAQQRPPRRPGLHRVLDRLDEIARLRPNEINLGALREALADLRKELGALLA